MAAAAGFGFLAGMQRAPGADIRLALENFITSRSFSEVENARAVLTGLSRHSLHEWGELYLAQMSSPDGPERAARMEELIVDLDRRAAEFAGTAEHSLFLERLLIVLNQNGSSGPWLDHYLAALYQNPAGRLPRMHAEAAVRHAQTLAREGELLEALQHLLRVPAAHRSAPDAAVSLAAEQLKARRSDPPILFSILSCPKQTLNR